MPLARKSQWQWEHGLPARYSHWDRELHKCSGVAKDSVREGEQAIWSPVASLAIHHPSPQFSSPVDLHWTEQIKKEAFS